LAQNKALKEHFWGQKHIFKRKKPGFRAKVRKVGIHVAIQKMKISSTSKTCDMSNFFNLLGKPRLIPSFPPGWDCQDLAGLSMHNGFSSGRLEWA